MAQSVQRRRKTPAYLSISDLCIRWKVDRRTAYKMLSTWHIPIMRLSPRVWRISRAVLVTCEREHAIKLS